MQMPRAERRTLFIFPIFLSVVVGGSLTVYGIENFSAWKFAGAALVPIALVQAVRLVTPGWLMTALSYMTMIAGVVCADLLLEASVFQ
jgi:apolipoprotein N-acyltransferase